jgi:O-acetyl-ADP-ribose deacetylase (regulator of RNase III)
MIHYTTGDILTDQSEALVNTVNCVGVMGRGIALQFKNAFPHNFKAYVAACKLGDVQPGRLFVYETGQLTPPRYIVNFPTKRHWRGKSRIEDVAAGLSALSGLITERGIRSIAIPPLGSGLGGLDWNQVRPLIERALAPLSEVDIRVYEPGAAPVPEKMHKASEIPRMTAGRAALVELMNRYIAGLLDPTVTLLELHKLMYFMQEAGEPLRLRYRPALYGPYAENLRHVLKTVEGHFTSGYADGGDSPEKQLSLVPGVVNDAATFLEAHPETRERFDRVAALVEGFESPFGLELLSTVHWVATRNTITSFDDAVERTYAWGDRKRQFTPRQIGIALDVLSANGWVETGIEQGIGRT